MFEKLELYINKNLELGNLDKVCCDYETFEYSVMPKKAKAVYECEKCSSINEYINNNKNESEFQKLLFKYIDERGLSDSEVYNKVHIDRRLFSKIRSDINYHPSKETVILLGLALELNEDEFLNLLNSASYSLPKNNNYDLIIRFCFLEGIYKVMDVNELLDKYNCKLFSY